MSRISVSKLAKAEMEVGMPIEIYYDGASNLALRFGYWNRLSQAQLSSLQEALGVMSNAITEDLYEDDDGDDDYGKPIIRRLYSYTLNQ
tara:strand:- start:21 stop:287 length:267 start_codon:yes stop_codon:yes gene_type:complete